MKTLMLVGAMIGFLLGLSLGLAGRAAWPAALLRGALAAVALGSLLRWWSGVWMRGLHTSLLERHAAADAAADAAANPPQPAAPMRK